jgi:hypothetical protein
MESAGRALCDRWGPPTAAIESLGQLGMCWASREGAEPSGRAPGAPDPLRTAGKCYKML